MIKSQGAGDVKRKSGNMFAQTPLFGGSEHGLVRPESRRFQNGFRQNALKNAGKAGAKGTVIQVSKAVPEPFRNAFRFQFRKKMNPDRNGMVLLQRHGGIAGELEDADAADAVIRKEQLAGFPADTVPVHEKT